MPSKVQTFSSLVNLSYGCEIVFPFRDFETEVITEKLRREIIPRCLVGCVDDKIETFHSTEVQPLISTDTITDGLDVLRSDLNCFKHGSPSSNRHEPFPLLGAAPRLWLLVLTTTQHPRETP